MKRTVKVWMAAVMSGVLLAGGAAMTGQARGEWRPRLIQAEPMPAEDTGITRMPAGWEAITTTAEVIRHTCIPMECVPMQEAGKVPRPRPGPRQNPSTQAQHPGLQAPAQHPGPRATGPSSPGQQAHGADSDTGTGSGLGSFRGRRNFRYFGLASEWGILELYL